MEWIVALVALTAMEIVLGIDNIVFIAILVGRLPEAQRAKARTIGLGLALITRILLLLTLTWILGLTEPLFEWTDFGIPAAWFAEEHGQEINGVSVRDLILIVGGLFLIYKSVHEVHEKIEGHKGGDDVDSVQVSFGSVLAQIAVIDIVFSLDSVITAVGMVDASLLWVMITAVILSICVMLIFAGRVSAFVERHQTVKMLALSFLILIGVMLVAEGIGTHFNKGYVYFAMAFSLMVEMLNLRMKSKAAVKAEAAIGGE
ncbi:MAG: TerC family protein [Planctomycetota bacterium]|nr:TerC family protein [Planctomycetota bacterium]